MSNPTRPSDFGDNCLTCGLYVESCKEKQPAPTPTVEESALKIANRVDGVLCDEIAWAIAERKIVNLVHSALAQARAEARREAADDFCALRPGKGQVCIMDDRDKCHDRAAILGRKP